MAAERDDSGEFGARAESVQSRRRIEATGCAGRRGGTWVFAHFQQRADEVANGERPRRKVRSSKQQSYASQVPTSRGEIHFCDPQFYSEKTRPIHLATTEVHTSASTETASSKESSAETQLQRQVRLSAGVERSSSQC